MKLIEIAQAIWHQTCPVSLDNQIMYVQHVNGQISHQSEVLFHEEPGYMSVCRPDDLLDDLRGSHVIAYLDEEEFDIEKAVASFCKDCNEIQALISSIKFSEVPCG